MKKKKKQAPLTRNELYSGAVSANECTGLTATVPMDEAEAKAYRDLAAVPVESEKRLKFKRNGNDTP